MISECSYQNCSHTPKRDSRFCSQDCERYYYRENAKAVNPKAKLVVYGQRDRRRALVYKVVTQYWKNAYELYLPLRLEGFEATLRTLKRDLDALVDDGLLERKYPRPTSARVNPAVEYRKPSRSKR